jgi:hypothetical protein
MNERDHPENLGVDGSILLKLILKKWGVGCRLKSPGCG